MIEQLREICKAFGLHPVENKSGVEAWRCQVVGQEALVIIDKEGWFRAWPNSQEPFENRVSTMAFGPTNLERLLCTKA
jgi:hypothetical protein